MYRIIFVGKVNLLNESLYFKEISEWEFTGDWMWLKKLFEVVRFVANYDWSDDYGC
jgi:hypothetical protein